MNRPDPYLAAQLAQLELRLGERIIASERAVRTAIDGTRNSIDGTRNMVLGTYGLILVAIFVNHFWH
jgi:hypothetical protein